MSNLIGIIGSAIGGLAGHRLAGLPGLMIGASLGATASLVPPYVRLARLEISSARGEIAHTALGIGLVALVVSGAWLASVAGFDRAIATAGIGVAVIAPYVLRTGLRANRALRLR
jgi:hypothetical protein